MRKPVDRPRLEEFMKQLGRLATSPRTIYFTGGSTALLLEIREQTVDIDIKLDPEPDGVFEAIAELKETLGVTVELAAHDQFVPPLPGWRERSLPILTAGRVEFKHYDLYSQTLAKIERGHALDLRGCRDLHRAGPGCPGGDGTALRSRSARDHPVPRLGCRGSGAATAEVPG